ncbi:AIR synthase-related protein [Ponticaulis koreensis]|uniref:AIR synthase-related protein n=1 Tax=Ponticaulis koreensis TaxID=1123045 RepID=UPI0003B32F03|nr:AIR synthase-related protein [Ponticaulis koreensis]
MTFDISKYPEPEDYGEVLLRLMASPHRRPAPVFPGVESLPDAQPGDVLIQIGETKGHLGASLYSREWLGLKDDELGPPPPVDLAVEKKNADFVHSLIEQGFVNAVLDIRDGGIACAVAEMALASGIGVAFDYCIDEPWRAFEEINGVFLLAVKRKRTDHIIDLSRQQNIHAEDLMTYFGGDEISFDTHGALDHGWNLTLSSLREAINAG